MWCPGLTGLNITVVVAVVQSSDWQTINAYLLGHHFLKKMDINKMMFFCPKLWWYLICPPCWTNLSFFTKVGWLCEGLTWKPLNSCLTQGLEPMDYQPVLSRHTSRRHTAVIFIVMYSGRLKNMFYLYYFQIFNKWTYFMCCHAANELIHMFIAVYK